MGAKGSCLRETVEDVIELANENPSQTIDLMDLDPAKVNDIPMKGKRINARVYDVYDGDSCSVIYDAGGYACKTKIRVMGIDCPEMKPRVDDEKLKELEKAAALKCRNFVEAHVLNQIVTIILHKHDKYGGRILADIFIREATDDISLSEMMISEGYARAYQGEEKVPWTEKELTSPPFQ